jgi:MFS family permease
MLPQRSFHALRYRDFRRLWFAMLWSLTGSQMQVVAIHWHVYLLTRSPIALGAVGLTRALPIIGLALWGGILADRRDRRVVMIGTQTLMAACAVGLAAVTFGGWDRLAAIYALSALSAAATAFDAPARQALLPRLVPIEHLPGALTLNLTAFHGAMILGPALAGVLLAGGSGPAAPVEVAAATIESRRDLAWIYALNAVSFLPVILSLAFTDPAAGRTRSRPGATSLASLGEGFRFVFRTPVLVWTMALDFFATFFAGANTLLPIFSDQVLGAGPAGYGLLAAAPALGAFAGSLFTALRPPPRKQGPILLWAVAAYGVATIVFGASRWFWLTFAALAGSGLADLISTVVRQTLRQLVTPDPLRGRMTAINMIFFMGGPQLGEVEAGLLASLFSSPAQGATVSVVTGGVATVLLAAAVAILSPAVRRYTLASSGPDDEEAEPRRGP